MTIPVKKIGEISLAIFESIFATKICNFQDNKAIIAYFNEFDESILSLIHEKINDEYELEKVDDYILKNPLFNERKYQFITEDEKINFIDEFYKKNSDLKYIGSKRINQCLETYIDKINELLNNLLSSEGKILLHQMRNSTSSILSELKDNTQELKQTQQDIKEIKETLLSNQANEAFPFPIPSFYNISRKNKLFSGREDILNNVFLQLAENNLVFLTGPGGIGKSQIARETVFQAKSKYELILWFSVNSEYDLVEEFNNAALYYKLIPEKSTDFFHFPNWKLSVLKHQILLHILLESCLLQSEFFLSSLQLSFQLTFPLYNNALSQVCHNRVFYTRYYRFTCM